jgi:DNA-binding response OmpR family regulator
MTANKILIIEDDQLVANIYRNKFTVEHFQVEIALDGHTGYEVIKSFRPDVVILDLMLPKVTGIELLKKIRAEAEFKHLPVIVFSNTYLSNMVQEAWKAGATKCLSKSNCTPKQVISVVRSLLPEESASAKGKNKAQPSAKPPGNPVQPQFEIDDAAADAAFLAELRASLVASLPGILNSMRITLQQLTKAADEAARITSLQELYRQVHALAGNAGICGMHQISPMANAFEALLKELSEKPKGINASTLRTVALAVDFLGVLFGRAKTSDIHDPFEVSEAQIMVVDDEAISRRAVCFSLEKAGLQATAVEDPHSALQTATTKSFDLIFLDVNMPGMNGFELCTKLRALANYRQTPIIFVTSLSDFESRANSTLSGGNDLIAKPFLFIELTVKSLVHLLRSRLGSPNQPSGSPR